MTIRLRSCLVIAAAVAFCFGSHAADNDNEFEVRTHYRTYSFTSMSGRARGLGGSYAALSNGAAGTIENPAGLGAQTDHQVLLELGLDQVDVVGEEADVITVNAGGAINLNHTAPGTWPREQVGNHTLGLMLHHQGLDFAAYDGRSAGITGLTGAYGRSLMGGQAFVGGSLAYAVGDEDNDSGVYDRSTDRWELKIGGIVRPVRELALGATFSYGGGSIQDDYASDTLDEGDIRHLEFRVGTAYQVNDLTLLVGDVAREDLDSEFGEDDLTQEHNIWRFSAGIERICIPERLTLRAGIYMFSDEYKSENAPGSNQTDDYVGVTGGFSWYGENVEVGWNLDIRSSAEIGNHFTLGFEW